MKSPLTKLKLYLDTTIPSYVFALDSPERMEITRRIMSLVATLYNVDALISWNFGHLVNIRRAKAIAVINAERGLPHIEIVTPEEVLP